MAELRSAWYICAGEISSKGPSKGLQGLHCEGNGKKERKKKDNRFEKKTRDTSRDTSEEPQEPQ